MGSSFRYLKFATAFFLAISSPSAVFAEDGQKLPEDLTSIGLKRLLDFDLVVTSPGKKEQHLSHTASAITVITQDDIRRSGATTVAEVLRLVPGLDVARVSSSHWAISARGFNQVFAHKLLVLVDGVSVFSPLTNGVYWDTQDVFLPDIERIEVIRGPGAALWGSNAVNGVINIITKSAAETKGGMVTVGGGLHERAFLGARQGAQIGEDTALRIAGKWTERAENRLVSGGDADDDWQIGSLDFRADSKIDEGESVTVLAHGFSQADEVRATIPTQLPPFADSTTFSGPSKWKGGFSGLRYTNALSERSEFTAAGSGYYQERDSNFSSDDYHWYELDLQHRLKATDDHEFVYGVSYRHFYNAVDGTYAESGQSDKQRQDRYNGFVQDDIALDGEKLHLIVGSKFEQNPITGFEYMPNARVVWRPDSVNSFWGAVSRAVAPPTIVFEDITFPAAAIPDLAPPLNGLVTVFGSPQIESENLLSYELGYRASLSEEVSVDLAVFYSQYDDLQSLEPGEPYVGVPTYSSIPSIIVPLYFSNALRGRSVGGESVVEYRPNDTLRLLLSYAFVDIDLVRGASQDASNFALAEGGTPAHQVSLRSLWNVSDSVTLDGQFRFVDRLTLGSVPGYGELDLRLAWRPVESLELSLVGQNLINGSHPEFVSNLYGPPPIEIERTVFASITWQY